MKEEGLKELFKQLRGNCKNITSLDICDNFVRGTATEELTLLIKDCLSLRNLNLSDSINEEQNGAILTAFEVILDKFRNLKTESGRKLDIILLNWTKIRL